MRALASHENIYTVLSMQALWVFFRCGIKLEVEAHKLINR